MKMNQDDEKRFIEDPGAMMLDHPKMYSWVQPVIAVLGLWLISSPLLFPYQSVALVWSDVISGVLMITIAAIAFFLPRYSWISYSNAAVGFWLIVAPLVFWSPSAAVYAVDTLIGTLVIAFSFVIPMSMSMPGPNIPPGWSYNPSTWVQRAPIIALGLLGFYLARPMAAYQLGHVGWVWEPLFIPGTESVLTSDVSKAFPISDAGLGAATYLIEVLSTFMGDQKRWRTMPWMVAMFGLAVIPLGLTSIILVIMQPLVVGAWCTLCLITAAAMLIMVPLALDEVVAMIQFLNHKRKMGESIWHVFWHGGNLPDASEKPRRDRRPKLNFASSIWGVSIHWGMVATLAIGIWLMFLPSVLGVSGAQSDNSHLLGALVVTVSAIAFAEVARTFRFLNIVFGIWLVASAWLLDGGTQVSSWALTVSGIFLMMLSLRLGPVLDRYGTYNVWVFWGPKWLSKIPRGLRRELNA